MAEHRPFPASARRLGLARQAGMHAASPLLVGAVAFGAGVLAVIATGGSLAHRLGDALAAACAGRGSLAATALAREVGSAVLPVAGAAATAALLAHVAQTRALWLPRRSIPGAPTGDTGPGPRAVRAAGSLAAALVIGGVALGWLWWAAPRLAAIVERAPASSLPTAPAPLAVAAGLLAHLGATLATAWLALGVLDALARHAAHRQALAMTAADKREDDRLAGADPRWRARRDALARAPGGARDAVAGAAVVLVGDDTAVAIAWDPVRRPIPVCTAAGRGHRASQLVALARRHHVAIHRDPALAARLAVGDGPVAERDWPPLADILAATSRRDRGG